jgi:peptide/nickel transport system substrate-binding protein
MVDDVLAGYGRPASIIWPPQALGYDAAQDQTYTYDLDRARHLLNEAGWNTTTKVTLLVAAELRATVSMAENYQADLNVIGVNAALQQSSTAEALALLQKRRVGGAWIAPTTLMNFGPTTFFVSNPVARVPNPSNFSSDQYTNLIAQAARAPDDQQLKPIVHDLTRLTRRAAGPRRRAHMQY